MTNTRTTGVIREAADRVARAGFAANAIRAASGRAAPADAAPRGMRGSGLYLRGGEDMVDPITLNRIPRARAVRVGKQWFDSKTLRALLERNAAAKNPLTRQPFPNSVYAKYGRKQAKTSASLLDEVRQLARLTHARTSQMFGEVAERAGYMVTKDRFTSRAEKKIAPIYRLQAYFDEGLSHVRQVIVTGEDWIVAKRNNFMSQTSAAPRDVVALVRSIELTAAEQHPQEVAQQPPMLRARPLRGAARGVRVGRRR